jgi:extradiol dioxygenase family protein
MREQYNVFHLAIPCKDLDETVEFYVFKLGCKLARRYADRVTIDFFGDQVVCHLNPESIDPSPKLYPRHFGITFRDKMEFDNLLKLIQIREIPVFTPLFTRFTKTAEEHSSIVLVDPANNLLEFKYYIDPRMMY